MSKAVPSILQARNRAWHYWGTDGIYAMTQGVALLFFGLGYLWEHYNRGSNLTGILILISLAIQVDQLFFRKTVGWLKSRITYPRTGYIKPPLLGTPLPRPALLSPAEQEQLRKRKWFWLALAGWLAVLMALLGYGLVAGHRWVLAAANVGMALMVLHSGKWDKLVWYLCSPILLGGAFLAFLPPDWRTSAAIMIIALATSIILMGATALSRYLKGHPTPQA